MKLHSSVASTIRETGAERFGLRGDAFHLYSGVPGWNLGRDADAVALLTPSKKMWREYIRLGCYGSQIFSSLVFIVCHQIIRRYRVGIAKLEINIK